MSHRLLLASLFLLLGANAHAAMDRVHNASGDTGSPCPPAVLTDSNDADEAKTGLTSPAATKPAMPNSGNSTAPTMQRPTLRWHSFLPGMMK